MRKIWLILLALAMAVLPALAEAADIYTILITDGKELKPPWKPTGARCC